MTQIVRILFTISVSAFFQE